jgi:hypothetical protein
LSLLYGSKPNTEILSELNRALKFLGTLLSFILIAPLWLWNITWNCFKVMASFQSSQSHDVDLNLDKVMKAHNYFRSFR